MPEKTTAEKIAEELLKQNMMGESHKENSAVAPPIKKAAKPNAKTQAPPIKEKRYYDVKVESMIPAVLTFRVLAEDPQQASELIRGLNPVGVKHRLVGRRDQKLTVYEAGSSMIKWVRNLVGM